MCRLHHAAAALLFLARGAAPSAWAGDQPQWGQQYSRNMVSEERGLPASLDPKSGRNVRWVVDIGTSSYSTPVVARGRVLIGTNNGNPRDPRHQGDRGVLLCFDEQTGRLVWQLVVPKLPHDPYLDCPGVGLTSSPAVEADRVYLVNNRAEVMCLDLHGLANGNDGPYQDESRRAAPLGVEPVALGNLDADILWVTDLRREVDAYPHDSANISVLVQGDHLYVSTPSGVDHTHRHRPAPHAPGLVVLDKHTGRLVARDDTGIGARVFHSTFSSPAFGVVNDRPLVFYGGGDGVVYAFEALAAVAAISSPARSPVSSPSRSLATLNVAWSFDCDPAAPKQNISQYQGNRRESPSSIVGLPVFYEGRIYVAAGGDPWHGKRECWLKCIDSTCTGDVTRTASLWSYPRRPGPSVPCPRRTMNNAPTPPPSTARPCVSTGLKETKPTARPTFSEELRHLANHFTDRPATLAAILAATRGRGFDLLLVLICLPFLTPIPLLVLSTPFGLVVFLIGTRLALA